MRHTRGEVQRHMDRAAYWLMAASTLICPVVIWFAGRVMGLSDFGSPNPFIGYRTALSMRNQDTWDFANADCARRFQKAGPWMAAASFAVMLCVMAAPPDIQTAVLLVVMGAQVACVCIEAWLVEKDLRRTFDKDGTRRTTTPDSNPPGSPGA